MGSRLDFIVLLLVIVAGAVLLVVTVLDGASLVQTLLIIAFVGGLASRWAVTSGALSYLRRNRSS